MDDTGDVTENGQEDVDEKVGTTATLEEHTKRRKDDGDNDLDDVAAEMSVRNRSLPFRRVHSAGRVGVMADLRSGERHVGGVFWCIRRSVCGIEDFLGVVRVW